MTHLDASTYRYRRTDQDRLGEWRPIGSSWKTAASAGLVAHDIYHHLPTDDGTFAQEVAALGAEWYFDVQALDGENMAAWPLSGFERNVIDSVLNAIDSREKRAFHLEPREASPLSAPEMEFFQRMGRKTMEVLATRKDERGFDPAVFELRYVQHLLWGYWQAQARFPDQVAARKACKRLVQELAYLELSEVPYEHEVTITLDGYRSTITYTDADAEFLGQNQALQAVMMIWCSCEPGYPAKHATLHATVREYAEHLDEHFKREETLGLASDLVLIPQGEQHDLSNVYVLDTAIQALLRAGQAVTLPLARVHDADFTPRGIRIF